MCALNRREHLLLEVACSRLKMFLNFGAKKSYKKMLAYSSMQLRSLITRSAVQSLTLHKAGENDFQSRVLQAGGKPRCWLQSSSYVKVLAKVGAKMGANICARICAKIWARNFCDQMLWKMSTTKIHPNLRLCSGTLYTSAIDRNRRCWGSVNLGVL